MYDRANYILSELPLKSDLLKLFSKKDKLTIFDIGGCEGEDSIRYSKLFPNASIYVFEPLPSNQKLIEENISMYKVENVKLIRQALSDTISLEKFYVSSGRPKDIDENVNWDFGNKSSSLLPPDKLEELIPWLKFQDTIEVSTNTIANLAEEYSINTIDFIHMDVQGAEMKVLKGAKDRIADIKAVWLEVSDSDLYKGQPKKRDVEVYMKENKFDLVKSEFDGVNGDQLYINKLHYKTLSFIGIKRYFKLK